MSFNLVEKKRYPAKDVLKDIEKLRKFDSGVARFVLTFFTDYSQIPPREFERSKLVKYADGMRKHGIIDASKIAEGFSQFHAAIGCLPLIGDGTISAGTALGLGIDVRVLYWLFDVNG